MSARTCSSFSFLLPQGMELYEQETPDFKSHTLPLARIKKVMKMDEDVKVCPHAFASPLSPPALRRSSISLIPSSQADLTLTHALR